MNLYLHQPREVSIETLALCNAACTFCPYPTLERKGMEMPTDTVLHLINEMSEFKEPFFFSPFKVNEPLLDRRLKRFCHAFESQCPVGKIRLFTNGQGLIQKHIDWIGNLNRLEHLWISLNSTDEDEYQNLMALNWQKTATRLDILHEQKFPYPVVLSRVMQSETPAPNNADLKFLRDCAHEWPKFRAILIKRDAWLGHVTPSDPRVPNAPCSRWEELSIMADGCAALCCMDGKGEYRIGNIHKNSLLEIYNSPGWLNRRLHSMSRKQIFPCSQCTY